MSLLLISWVCAHCTSESDGPPAIGKTRENPEARPPGGHPTGFPALDAIISTGGYPIGAITELFGDDATLEMCRDKVSCHFQLDLEQPTEKLLRWVADMLPTCPLVTVQVRGGTGARYAALVTVLHDAVQQSSSGVVLLNAAVRTKPHFSVAPGIVKTSAALRVRVQSGLATVVKDRWGDTGAWCTLEV